MSLSINQHKSSGGEIIVFTHSYHLIFNQLQSKCNIKKIRPLPLRGRDCRLNYISSCISPNNSIISIIKNIDQSGNKFLF